MHVAATYVYDPSTAPNGVWGFEELKAEIERRLHLLPPYRRRLAEIPFQLHHRRAPEGGRSGVVTPPGTVYRRRSTRTWLSW